MEISNLINLLASLAHESRILIFKQLVQAGPAGITPMQLSENLDMPPATLSFHLKELYRAELCNKVKQGRNIIYSANFNSIQLLIDFLLENCCSGSSCNTQNQTGEV